MDKENLEKRIWETRKIRINSESRLIRNAHIIDYLIPWYSLNFIVITLAPFQKNNDWLVFISVCGSLLILITSILMSNMNYKVRAYKMKLHYLELDALLHQLKDLSINTDDIYHKYNEYLKNIENHTNWDYKKTLIQYKKSKTTFPKLETKNEIFFRIKQILLIIFFLILFVIPLSFYCIM